jgi:hypothetical protein
LRARCGCRACFAKSVAEGVACESQIVGILLRQNPEFHPMAKGWIRPDWTL